jgi:hypothetical protein
MSYEELYEDRDEARMEQIEAALVAEMARNEAQTPVWCKAITLSDLAALSDVDQRSTQFAEMASHAAAWFTSGWTTPERIADWLWEYSKQTGDGQWTAMSKSANPFGEDVLVLIAASDNTADESFRDHFGRLAKNRSRPRPPRAATLLRRFITEHGDQVVRPIQEVIVPTDKGLWAAVVFGPLEDLLCEASFLRQEVFQAAGKHNKHHEFVHFRGIELFVWRFKTLKDHRRFIEAAQRAVGQLIEAEGLASDEYLSALASTSPSI